MTDEIEKMFAQECRDKKRTASGARHNSGRRGGGTKGITGAMRMPSDLLKFSDKEAYKTYTKASDIIMSNIFEDINNLPTLKELKSKDYKAAQSILKAAKANHTMKTLIKYWDSSSGSLYKLFDYYKVEYPKRPKKGTELIAASTSNDIEEQQAKLLYESQLAKEMEERQLIETNEARQLLSVKLSKLTEENNEEENFQLKYTSKDVTGDEIQDRIMNYINILIKDNRYEVRLVIKELPNLKNE